MTDQQIQNLLNYAGAIALGIVLAGGIVLQQQLASGGPIDWTPVLAAALASLLTALRATMLPKVGDEQHIPTVGEIADELERRRQERVVSRLHEVSNG